MVEKKLMAKFDQTEGYEVSLLDATTPSTILSRTTRRSRSRLRPKPRPLPFDHASSEEDGEGDHKKGQTLTEKYQRLKREHERVKRELRRTTSQLHKTQRKLERNKAKMAGVLEDYKHNIDLFAERDRELEEMDAERERRDTRDERVAEKLATAAALMNEARSELIKTDTSPATPSLLHSLLPPGTVLMWHKVGALPDGWRICDGRYARLDLSGMGRIHARPETDPNELRWRAGLLQKGVLFIVKD